jgi:tRNA pseudouridine55 synthase
VNPLGGGRSWCGVLNLNKPSGLTSRQALDRVARFLPRTKVGHAGTLDPLASGVLVLCVGAATRLVEFVQRLPKTYRTTIRLGVTSDTLDAQGHLTPVSDPAIPNVDDVRRAIATQVGQLDQVPPQFSALKVAGERAYDLARAGRRVQLGARRVDVHRIELLDYEWPRVSLEIDCGSGTYIRSIARDLGETLGCGGLVELLERTRIGHFTLDGALSLDDLSAERVEDHLRPALEAVWELPRVQISEEELTAVCRGKAVAAASAERRTLAAGEVALVGPDGLLGAVAEHDTAARGLLPRRVLVQPGNPRDFREP